MAKVKVLCIEARQVGDDVYNVTGEYTMDELRAKKYPNHFEVIGKVAAKKRKAAANKNAGTVVDK